MVWSNEYLIFEKPWFETQAWKFLDFKLPNTEKINSLTELYNSSIQYKSSTISNKQILKLTKTVLKLVLCTNYIGATNDVNCNNKMVHFIS